MAASNKKKKSILNEIKETITGKKEPVSVQKIIENNRKKGDEIIATLKAIDFNHGLYEGRADNDSKENMQNKVAAIIRVMERTQTISDNISKIDEVMLFASQALSSAIKEGSYYKAIWAKNALSAGVLYIRDNIPQDMENFKEENLDARSKYMNNYRAIIQLYDKVDKKEAEIKEHDVEILKLHKEYDPKVKEIKDLKNTKEGRLSYGRISENQHTPSMLDKQERQLLLMVQQTASMAHTIFRRNSMREAAQLEYETALDQATDIRTTLTNRPVVFNPELSAYHALVMDEQIKAITHAYAEAAAFVENVNQSDAKLRSILDGADAQTLTVNSVQFMDKILYGEENNDIDAVRAGNRMAKRANEAEQERRNMQMAARVEMEKVPHFEENDDLSALFAEHYEESFAENFAENETVEENVNANSNVEYNYNS